jgi:hypothetical protein
MAWKPGLCAPADGPEEEVEFCFEETFGEQMRLWFFQSSF